MSECCSISYLTLSAVCSTCPLCCLFLFRAIENGDTEPSVTLSDQILNWRWQAAQCPSQNSTAVPFVKQNRFRLPHKSPLARVRYGAMLCASTILED